MIPQRLLPHQLPLIEHKVGEAVIAQRPTDGYINATAMCQKAGKLWNNYWRNDSTQDFVNALSATTRIRVMVLIQTLMGGNDPKLRGTWVHPKVAIHLAQWLSPQFAVQVTEWVFDWMSGKSSGFMPSHVRRYMANRAKIPPSHFSMLNEMFLHLIAPLEESGYVLPDKLLPDASTGRMFSGFLRKKGINVDDFPQYEHEFLDGKRPVVYARLYPNEYLAEFRDYFHKTWMPARAKDYFTARDPDALPHLIPIIAALPAPADESE